MIKLVNANRCYDDLLPGRVERVCMHTQCILNVLPEGVFYKNDIIYFAVFTSYMAIYMYVPIVMCGLRLLLFTTTTVFTTIIIEMCSLKSMCMTSFILIGCGVSDIYVYG